MVIVDHNHVHAMPACVYVCDAITKALSALNCDPCQQMQHMKQTNLCTGHALVISLHQHKRPIPMDIVSDS